MPERVKKGEPVVLELEAVGVRDLAGYEMLVAFDRAAAEFAGTEGIREAFAGTGRHVAPLGPVETPDGVWLGLYSCPFKDCVTARGVRRDPGASGRVALGRIRLLPSVTGRLEVRLAAVRLVDIRGRSVPVTVPESAMTVGVARGARAPTLRASRPAMRLGNGSVPRAVRADVTNDGRVSHSDVMELAIGWRSARMGSGPCGLGAALDLNGDGCTDITDIQAAAAAVTSSAGALGAEGSRDTAHVGTDAEAVTASVGTFTVTSTGDQADTNPGDRICWTSSGCTLRAAITEANLRDGPDTIGFAIPGTGIKRIQITSKLPTINDLTGPTTIDGYTQPGSAPNTDPLVQNAVIRVEVRGSAGTIDGLTITSPGNVVRGLAMFNLRLIVNLQGPGASDNEIVGNFVGTDATGTFVSPYVSGGQSVYIQQGSAFNRIGAPTLADRNLISGGGNNAVRTWHELSDHNLIQNNLIGLGRTGLPLRNAAHGIDINAGSSYNLIGGDGPLERNVVSANLGEGIEFSHGTLTISNRAIGNFVGTDVSGNGGAGAGYGNGTNGIKVEDGAINSVIVDNVVGNNGFRSDTQGGGIGILGRYTAGTRVRDNRIGVGLSGQPVPNDESGILIYYYAAWNDIGPDNVIAHNPVGVEVSAHANKYNTITRNSIYRNSLLGINLQGGTAVSPNDGIADSDDGANGLLNFPVLTGATNGRASGTACAGCTVEIFAADRVATDAGGGDYGQGRGLVGSGVVASDRTFSVALSGVATGDHLTATATDALGNTSEFSLNILVPTGSPPVPPPQPPPPDGTIIAADSFSRTVADTWGRATVGGAYGYFYCTAHHFDVTGSAGTFLAPAPSSTEACPYQPELTVTKQRGALLTEVSERDIDMRVRVRSSMAASGDNQNVLLTARRWRGGTEYRGHVRLTPSGQVWLQAARVVSDASVGLGSSIRAPGATHAAGQDVWMRMQVTGADPTTIRVKAWNPGSAEPSSWAYQITDSEPELQRAGGVGLMASLSGATNNGPVSFSFDDFTVTSLGEAPPPPPPPAPVADFTWQQTAGTLEVGFSDTSTGSPTSWSWDLGDGSTSTQQSPSHTYTAPGDYQVTLTASNAGGSDSRTRTVTVEPLPPPPPPPPTTTTYAADTFTRTASGSWGSADTGGTYVHNGPAGSFAVNGTRGTVSVGSASGSRGALLSSVTAQDVRLGFSVSADKAPTGHGQYLYAAARRTSGGDEYRIRLRLAANGQIYVGASRITGGSETVLAPDVAAGFSHSVDGQVHLRAEIEGSSPTTFRVRAWPASASEPTSWAFTTSDSTAGLQSTGSVGLRTYLPGNTTNAPVLFSFDDFTVTSLEP